MDPRITKTNQAIRDAFLSLRSKYPLDKVKVKDICSVAAINKTTFYKYYQDVYALSEKIENDTIKLFINTFTAKDLLFTDPYKFIVEYQTVLEYYEELLHTLFRDCRSVFTDKLTKALIKYYQPENYTVASDIQLSYILNGTFSTMYDMKNKYSTEAIAEHLAELIKKSSY